MGISGAAWRRKDGIAAGEQPVDVAKCPELVAVVRAVLLASDVAKCTELVAVVRAVGTDGAAGAGACAAVDVPAHSAPAPTRADGAARAPAKAREPALRCCRSPTAPTFTSTAGLPNVNGWSTERVPSDPAP